MAYKEKDTKKWTAQWFEENALGEKSKHRKRGFDTKKEALEYERQKKLSTSKSMDMKLSAFMDVYFEDKQNELKERTLRNKRYMMEQHIVPYFGKKKMSEITAAQVLQWQNEMQGGLCTGITQNVSNLMSSEIATTMLSNSEFVVVMKQSNMDSAKMAEALKVSEEQLRYVKNAPAGTGLIKCGSVVIPFDNQIGKDTELYKIYSTNIHEKIAEQKKVAITENP